MYLSTSTITFTEPLPTHGTYFNYLHIQSNEEKLTSDTQKFFTNTLDLEMGAMQRGGNEGRGDLHYRHIFPYIIV